MMYNRDSSPPHVQKAPAVLPNDASWHSIGGVEGWLFALFDPYGDRYVFFLWRDGESFAVSLVDPPLERCGNAAAMKLQADGRLGPFGHGSQSTLLTAFQWSLAWMADRAIRQRLAAAESECPQYATRS